MTAERRIARALRSAAVHASKAPSVRNTQPWRFVLSSRSLDIYADQQRQLSALDPRGRQLVISCGCAVLNARSSIASSGFRATVRRFPRKGRPNLVAEIHIDEGADADSELARLDASAEEHVGRRQGQLVREEVPREVVEALVAAGITEGAQVVQIVEADDVAAVIDLNTLALSTSRPDPAGRAEMRAWAISDNLTARLPGQAIFESDWLPSPRTAGRWLSLFAIVGVTDDRHTWLQAGETLQRMLLIVEASGYAASPMTQALQAGAPYGWLPRGPDLPPYPHALLGVGIGRHRTHCLGDASSTCSQSSHDPLPSAEPYGGG